MELSQLLSWIGVVTGALIGIPQLIKTIRTKSVQDVSVTTFLLVLVTSVCMLIRAMVIKELAFIVYYALILLSAGLQLFLMWKYWKRVTLEPNER